MAENGPLKRKMVDIFQAYRNIQCSVPDIFSSLLVRRGVMIAVPAGGLGQQHHY